MTPDDQELVERVKDGNQEAFRQLFERYHQRVFAIAYGVVRNQQDALDLVQEAFVKVHRHIGSFQGASGFYTWLYRIVMNLAIDHIRRKKGKLLDFDERLGHEPEDVEGDGALLPTLLDSNPKRTVLRRELLGAIQAALDELPEHHRAVLVLREIEGLNYEQMADILQVPKGTIMSRLFHARRKMQDSLQEYLQGELSIKD